MTNPHIRPVGQAGSLLFLCVLNAGAHAARPMITDDARIVDPHGCQVESWAKKNSGSTEYWVMPACNFTGNLEVAMGGARANDSSGTSTTDEVIQGKAIIKPLKPNGWGVGVAVGANHHPNTTSSGSDIYVNVPASFSFKDDRFVLHINGGLSHAQDTKLNSGTWGIGSETQLSERNYLIAETFGQEREKPKQQIGLRHWIVPNRVQIDTTVGDPLAQNKNDRWFSVGLRLLSAP